MTEQREPHAGDEAEFDRPEDPRPDIGSWRPVQPAEADEPRAVAEPDDPSEAAGSDEASAEPTVVAEPEEASAEPTVVAEPEETSAEPTVAIASTETSPDDEKTTLQPLPIIGDQPVAASEPTESIFRPPSPTSASPEPEPTHIEQLSDEEQKLASERSARREARVAALAATAPVPSVAPEPLIVHKRTNDKFWGSLGLFLLRIVVAAIFAVRGMNLLTDIPAAQQQFAETVIPEPGIMAIATGVACLLIALSLVLGLLTRVAGLGIVLIAGGALAFVLWGPWSPFVPGQSGFVGEFELLLATVGMLFLLIGAGGWSLDRSFRAGRERDKAERSAPSEE